VVVLAAAGIVAVGSRALAGDCCQETVCPPAPSPCVQAPAPKVIVHMAPPEVVFREAPAAAVQAPAAAPATARSCLFPQHTQPVPTTVTMPAAAAPLAVPQMTMPVMATMVPAAPAYSFQPAAPVFASAPVYQAPAPPPTAIPVLPLMPVSPAQCASVAPTAPACGNGSAAPADLRPMVAAAVREALAAQQAAAYPRPAAPTAADAELDARLNRLADRVKALEDLVRIHDDELRKMKKEGQ
jgi:hypothetical protein